MRTAQLELYKSYILKDQNKPNDLGAIQFIMYYSDSNRTFTVTALKVSGIQRPLKCTKSTCLFASVSLKPGKTFSTKKVKFADEIEFLEIFEFPNIFDRDIQDMHLKIAVYRKDAMLSFPKFIGKAYVSLTEYDLNVGKAVWKALKPKS